jgi:hypothetical protein
MKDLKHLSISDKLSLEIGQIFSKRLKNTAIQYLVTVKGEMPDSARWIAQELLTMPGTDEKIRDFERNLKSGSLLQKEEDGYSHMPTIGTLPDSRADQNPQPTDDNSQGLSANKDQDDWDDVSDDTADPDSSDDLLLHVQRQGSITRRRESRGSKKIFPSAAAFVDALEHNPYLDFDIMDFDRPSLKKKPKGRRQIANLELSDSDLELHLEAAWEKDRSRKKARKQQREQLRSQGLLGRKPGKPDLETKYTSGMSIDHLKAELEYFLLSPSERYICSEQIVIE